MSDQWGVGHPVVRKTFEQLNADVERRMAEINREQETQRRRDEEQLNELRRVGKALHDARIAAEREAAAAAKAAAEQQHRDEVEAAVKRSFIASGGLPEEWEAERAEVMREHRRRAALQALEDDEKFWRRHVAAASASTLKGGAA